jgi:hypothetical protein
MCAARGRFNMPFLKATEPVDFCGRPYTLLVVVSTVLLRPVMAALLKRDRATDQRRTEAARP